MEQAETPGRDPRLLHSNRRSLSRRYPFLRRLGFSVGGMDLRTLGWRYICTSSLPTTTQIRVGHQLCPEGLAMVLLRFLVSFRPRLVPMADSPGPGPPDIPFLFLHLSTCTLLMDYGLDGRKTFYKLDIFAPADSSSWDLPLAYLLCQNRAEFAKGIT
jgi:hypothetical protein